MSVLQADDGVPHDDLVCECYEGPLDGERRSYAAVVASKFPNGHYVLATMDHGNGYGEKVMKYVYHHE